jgi:hypothetical protein
MSQRAAILVRPGPTEGDQTVALLRLCEERGYNVVGRCRCADDGVALVHSGAAAVVVAVYQVSREALDERVHDAGGRVEYVREPDRRLTARTWLLRWWRMGWSVQKIADTVGEQTGEIRVALRRAGEKPPPK